MIMWFMWFQTARAIVERLMSNAEKRKMRQLNLKFFGAPGVGGWAISRITVAQGLSNPKYRLAVDGLHKVWRLFNIF
jgi:hypothetical protein